MPFSSGRESVSGMINVFAGTWFRGRRRVDDVSFNESLPLFFISFYLLGMLFLARFFPVIFVILFFRYSNAIRTQGSQTWLKGHVSLISHLS